MKSAKKLKKFFTRQGGTKPKFDYLTYLITNPGLVHIPEQIFGYLDAKSVGKCRLVSAQWNSFLRKPFLIKQIWVFTHKITIEESIQKALVIYTKLAINYELKQILKVLKELCALSDLYGTKLSLIHLAVKNNCVKFMEVALQQEPHAYFRNGQGDKLLDIALNHEYVEMLKLLLKNNAESDHSIDSKSEFKWPILHQVIDLNWSAKFVIDILKVSRANHVNLHVRSGYVGLRKLRAQTPGTPLIIAIKNRSVEIVQALLEVALEYGIDLNATTDSYGNTALHFACSTTANERIVDLFLENAREKGINVMAVNKFGQTILHTAQKNHSNNEATIELLLKKGRNVGLDIYHHDVYGRTYQGMPEYLFKDQKF